MVPLSELTSTSSTLSFKSIPCCIPPALLSNRNSILPRLSEPHDDTLIVQLSELNSMFSDNLPFRSNRQSTNGALVGLPMPPNMLFTSMSMLTFIFMRSLVSGAESEPSSISVMLRFKTSWAGRLLTDSLPESLSAVVQAECSLELNWLELELIGVLSRVRVARIDVMFVLFSWDRSMEAIVLLPSRESTRSEL